MKETLILYFHFKPFPRFNHRQTHQNRWKTWSNIWLNRKKQCHKFSDLSKTSEPWPWVFCYSWSQCTFESLLHILPKVGFLSCGHLYHLLFDKICEAPSKSMSKKLFATSNMHNRKLKYKIRIISIPYSFGHIHPCQTKSCKAWDLF